MVKDFLCKHGPYNIVDGGCRAGFSELNGLYSECHYLGFDPATDAIKRNTEFLSEKTMALGLYDKMGEFPFYECNHPSMSSMLEFDKEGFIKHFGLVNNSAVWKHYLSPKRTSSVQTNTIDNILKEVKWNNIDYLKLDTQGTELSILKGAENLLNAQKIKVIKCEVAFIGTYKNQPLFQEIANYLSAKNFKTANLSFYSDAQYQSGSAAVKLNDFKEKINFGINGDAVFYLDNNLLNNSDKIKQAIILAASASYSLAYDFLKKSGITDQITLSLFNYFLAKQKKKKLSTKNLKLLAKKILYQ